MRGFRGRLFQGVTVNRKRLISIGGGAALGAGFLFSLFQIEFNFPWALAIGTLLIFWAGGLSGLYLRAPAGRVGLFGVALSLLGIGILFLGVLLGDKLGDLWGIFLVGMNLIPAGLVIYSFAVLRQRTLGPAGSVPLILGLLILGWMHFIDPASPLWIEQAIQSYPSASAGSSWGLFSSDRPLENRPRPAPLPQPGHWRVT